MTTADIRDFGALGDGKADDRAAIQAALDSGARRVIVPPGLYRVTDAVCLHSGQTFQIEGTLRLASANQQRLTADAKPGDHCLKVASTDGYQVGQYVAIMDDDRAIQGGGRQIRHSATEGRIIEKLAADAIHFAEPLGQTYRLSANARTGLLRSVVRVFDQNHVTICGSGIIDGNKAEQIDGYDESRGCGIDVGASEGRVERIDIREVIVCNAVLHNIRLSRATHSRITQVTCRAAHDKNMNIGASSDCLIQGNICADSEFEDGIIFHQTQKRGCERIMVQQNICTGNARHGIHVGANWKQVHLAGNLCVNNGCNISLGGTDGSSTGDVSLGGNYEVFERHPDRSGAWIAGQGNRVVNLTSRGYASVNLSIRARDAVVIGGSFGGDDETESEVGVCVAEPLTYTSSVLPENVAVRDALISRCRTGVRITGSAPREGSVRFCGNMFRDNGQDVDAAGREGRPEWVFESNIFDATPAEQWFHSKKKKKAQP